MTDIPIIFSKPMVIALLEGRKRMTRRLAWLKANTKRGSLGLAASPWRKVNAGDRLWVRENWRAVRARDGEKPREMLSAEVHYEADGPPRDGAPAGKLRPAIYLPRRFSRLTLIVEAVKIEPLHAMTIEDVIAEGIPQSASIGAFPALWDRLHGAGAWAANPEVIAIGFDVTERNIGLIDAAAEAAE